MVRVGAYYIRPTNAHNHRQMIDPLDTCWGVCNTPLPIRDKNLIPLRTMNLKPDTFQRVYNTPIPIRYKYLINTYFLNPILGKDWIIWIITPLKIGTFLGVCNIPLPIQIKNLIPIYRMNLKPDTCRGVCNTPLPILAKNLIPIYRMNLKPGMYQGVCNMPPPIRNKYLINMHLLNLILGKDWIIRVEVYCIRHTNTHDHGQMINPPGTFLGICNIPILIRYKYLINTYLLNPIPDKDWVVRVGAYCIRPTNAHDHGKMIDPPGMFWSICNTPLPIRIKNLIPIYWMNLKPDMFRGVCNTPIPVRAKNLIPIYWMNLKPDTFRGVCNTPLHIRIKNLIPIYWMNLKLVRFLGECLCDQPNHGEKPIKFV